MKVGYQGIPGSYSEMATLRFIEDCQLQEVDKIEYYHFRDLVTGLLNKEIDYAVIPVENSTTGMITRTMDLFKYQGLRAFKQYYLPIQHILWGLPEASIPDLSHVYSHPEALSQCQNFFLSHPHIKEMSYYDTALSAKMVAQEGNPHFAALASLRAGELYGLKALKTKIQSETTNTTRFLVFEAQKEVKIEQVQSHHLILYVETNHQPGALFKLLQVFDVFQCNLLALNARPIKDKPFQYGFFIEIDSRQMIGSFPALWSLIQQHSNYVQLLGEIQ